MSRTRQFPFVVPAQAGTQRRSPQDTGFPRSREWRARYFSHGASVPLRIIATDRVGRRGERVTAIELERLALALVFALETRERLHGGSGQRPEQLRHVRAALDAAHGFVEALAKTADEIRADELRIRGLDAIARARIRHPVGLDLDAVHVEAAIDRHADPHVVNGLARGPNAGQQLEIVVLDVVQMRVDVEKAILAPPAFVGDPARVQSLA